MGASSPGSQRLLINPLDGGGVISTGAWNMKSYSAEPYEGIEAKAGKTALKFRGEASPGGAKGDFTVGLFPPGEVQWIGAWVYLTPESNVGEVGFQITDAEGEVLLCKTPADWTGWKWVEMNLAAGGFAQAYEQAGKNHQVDYPIKAINFIWGTTNAGPTSVGINGLAAITKAETTGKPWTAELKSPVWGEPGQPAGGQLLVTNFSNDPLEIEIDYSIQRNPQLYDKPLPDPILGSDRAQGCPSWIEVDGSRIEDNSLTDGDEDTGYSSQYIPGHYTEAFQYVDLGKARKIIALTYQAGDANFIHKVDISTSMDGKNYTPAEGLQGLDFHSKWGAQVIPVKTPFAGRYLRLHYHNDGGKTDAIRLPSALYVYDGVAEEKMELPKVGELIEEKKSKLVVEPRNFALAPLASSTPLASGGYLAGAKITTKSGVQLLASDYFVMPAKELEARPESRFGMNVSTPSFIPMLKRLGIGWVRFENFKWMFFNPAPDDFRLDISASPWNVPFDSYMQQYRAAGLSILPYIFQTPAWSTSAPDTAQNNRQGYPPKDNADYGKAIFQAVARYGSTKVPAEKLKTPDAKTGLNLINTFELWNEPHLNAASWGPFVGTFEAYLDLFRVGAESAKQADPHAAVSIAGISMEFVDKIRTYKYPDGKTALDFMDILNVHYYSGRQDPELATDDPNSYRDGAKADQVQTYEKWLLDIADWRDELKPAMPIWLTETGYDVGGEIGRTERYQAAKLPRCIMIALASGVEKAFVYREAGSIRSMHAGAGVIRDDGSLRPSFFTLATLVRQLDGVKDDRVPRLQIPNSHAWMYHWKRGKDDVLTVWTPEGTEPLGIALGRCKVTDAFGAESEVEVGADFQVGIFPVYITQIANKAPLEKLEREAAAREQSRKKALALAAKSKAYLFRFGSANNLPTRKVGQQRVFTPVLANEVYSEEKGYGFTTPVQGKDVVQSWIQSDLDQALILMWGPNTFRIKAAPGRYKLECKGESQTDDSKLSINGGKEGVIALPLAKGSWTASTPVTVTPDKMIEIEIPSGMVRWVTLVELPPEGL